ncbi:MAG TPA: type VI secretion system contractile sheath large subunit, partial [Burkholderiales bacterium]|nr:type VI secretion system contractile sheath large subunit [Burkholderiales bacterium]
AASRSGAAPAVSGIDALIRDAVAPHIVPDAPPHQAQYLASVDAATCEQMNALLHSPAFQDLEALWRGVYRLVANLELGEELQLYVLDVTKRELLQDLAGAQTDLASSAVYRLLVDEASGTPGSEPWSLIAGHYDFGRGGEDVALLAALGAIGSHAGAPFLAAAKAEIAGCTTFAAAPDPGDWDDASGDDAQAWNSLRASAMAPWIGLAAPRMLLRLPYGKNAERIDAFEFDELGVKRQHEHYLWGNPALACVLLIGRAFAARGWDMAPGDELDVDDLPAHTFEADGEKHLQPCAEVLIIERAGQALLERGVMPLLSYKNRNAVRVLRFQSIAEPSRALSGPWS